MTLAVFVASLWAVSCEQPRRSPAPAGIAVQPTPEAKPTPAAVSPTAAPAKGWILAFKSDFSGPKLDPKWQAVQGQATVKDGAMILKADAGEAQVILKDVFDAPSVRAEFVVMLPKQDRFSDLSPLINTTLTGYPDGYLLQFGGKGNTLNIVDKGGEIESTSNTKGLPMKVEHKYIIVAENDKGHVTLTVDGQKVLDYADPIPLSGAKNGQIGFFTWGSEVRIEKVTVWQTSAEKR
jgi:hypothetical protein